MHLALALPGAHNFGSSHPLKAACHLGFSMHDLAELEADLARLKQEHRDLDMAIEALEQMIAGDQLQVQRLKKRKLVLKDRIIQIEDQITPDIIA